MFERFYNYPYDKTRQKEMRRFLESKYPSVSNFSLPFLDLCEVVLQMQSSIERLSNRSEYLSETLGKIDMKLSKNEKDDCEEESDD